MYRELNKNLFEFIENSPTAFHAVNSAKRVLLAAGYDELKLSEKWTMENGGKYFLTNNDSCLFAFEFPRIDYNGFHIVASHTDSPCFKLKSNPEIDYKGLYTTLNVEKYGGAIFSSWFDRSLSIAGRVLYEEDGKVVSKLIDFKKKCISIVNLAIHMNREVNTGVKYKVSNDLRPIWAGKDNDKSIKSVICEHLNEGGINISEDKILDMDMFVYNPQKGEIWGANDEFIQCPRLDDLQCVYSSLQAFIDTKSTEKAKVLALFDNEEIGSNTISGAASNLFTNIINRVMDIQGKTNEEKQICIENSFMLSADNAHAVHPNHADKADATNQPYPNGGVVVKYTANQQYTTNAQSGGYFKYLCKKNNVPVQDYFNHSDVLGGSTLGNLLIQKLPIKSVDIGAPQLAMHSCNEVSGIKDTEHLIEAMKAFYRV